MASQQSAPTTPAVPAAAATDPQSKLEALQKSLAAAQGKVGVSQSAIANATIDLKSSTDTIKSLTSQISDLGKYIAIRSSVTPTPTDQQANTDELAMDQQLIQTVTGGTWPSAARRAEITAIIASVDTAIGAAQKNADTIRGNLKATQYKVVTNQAALDAAKVLYQALQTAAKNAPATVKAARSSLALVRAAVQEALDADRFDEAWALQAKLAAQSTAFAAQVSDQTIADQQTKLDEAGAAIDTAQKALDTDAASRTHLMADSRSADALAADKLANRDDDILSQVGAMKPDELPVAVPPPTAATPPLTGSSTPSSTSGSAMQAAVSKQTPAEMKAT